MTTAPCRTLAPTYLRVSASRTRHPPSEVTTISSMFKLDDRYLPPPFPNMKLIIAGASGFVATECIRQSLSDPRFTTVIALARKAVSAPADLGPKADISKLQSVVIEDYGTWPEDVKERIKGADACIWTVAVTPGKAQFYAWEDVKKICRDHALAGLEAVVEARGDGGELPLRFVYMSGTAAERDQTKSPWLLKEHSLMRVRSCPSSPLTLKCTHMYSPSRAGRSRNSSPRSCGQISGESRSMLR
jgi:nucleoside-diphosphate-sugar epimerase